MTLSTNAIALVGRETTVRAFKKRRNKEELIPKIKQSKSDNFTGSHREKSIIIAMVIMEQIKKYHFLFWVHQ